MSAIHFDCPACGAHHDRGFVNGVDAFRCLRCGYYGHGWHADANIDREVQAEALAGRIADAAAGIARPDCPCARCDP